MALHSWAQGGGLRGCLRAGVDDAGARDDAREARRPGTRWAALLKCYSTVSPRLGILFGATDWTGAMCWWGSFPIHSVLPTHPTGVNLESRWIRITAEEHTSTSIGIGTGTDTDTDTDTGTNSERPGRHSMPLCTASFSPWAVSEPLSSNSIPRPRQAMQIRPHCILVEKGFLSRSVYMRHGWEGLRHVQYLNPLLG